MAVVFCDSKIFKLALPSMVLVLIFAVSCAPNDDIRVDLSEKQVDGVSARTFVCKGAHSYRPLGPGSAREGAAAGIYEELAFTVRYDLANDGETLIGSLSVVRDGAGKALYRLVSPEPRSADPYNVEYDVPMTYEGEVNTNDDVQEGTPERGPWQVYRFDRHSPAVEGQSLPWLHYRDIEGARELSELTEVWFPSTKTEDGSGKVLLYNRNGLVFASQGACAVGQPRPNITVVTMNVD